MQVEEAQLVLRVDEDVREVEGPRVHRRPAVHCAPASATILRLEQGGLPRLDEGVYDPWIAGIDAEADAAQLSLRKAVGGAEPSPSLPTVVREVESASLAPRLEEPWRAAELPHPGKQLLRILGVHDQIADPRALVHEEHALPRPPTVRRLVYAPLLAVAPRRPHHAHISDTGVRRVEHDPVNALGLFEPQERPRLSPVERSIDAGAHTGAVPRVSFARAHPDDVGMRLAHRDGPDARDSLVVEDGPPGLSSVDRLPQSTRCGSYVDDVGIGHESVDRRDPSAHARWSDVSGRHRVQQLRRYLRRHIRRQQRDGDHRDQAGSLWEEAHLQDLTLRFRHHAPQVRRQHVRLESREQPRPRR